MVARHFAKIDSNNIVQKVLVVDSSNAATEAQGQNFLRKLYQDPTAVWKLSDDSTNAQGVAGKTLIYDPVNKIFHEPQPYPSWTLNIATRTWEPPVPRPVREDDGKFQQWNEETQNWDIETARASGIFEPEA